LRETYSGKTGVLLENGTKGFAALWNESNDEKLENNTILTGLAINYELSDFDNFHIVLDINRKELFTSFRKGDIAILFPFSEQNDKSLINNQLLKCTIKSINSDSVTISLRNKLISTNIFYNNQLWKLEPDHIDSLDKHSYSSIFNFLQCNEKKKNLIFGLAEPEFSNITIFESDELNENQKNIVQSAVSSKDYYLIQGPPGTGKTNIVLKHIIKYLAENTEDNLLVCAYTNRAVDEISNAIKNIFPQVDYIRIGSKEATDDKKHHLPSIVDNDGLNPAYKRIKNSRIIISTIASIMTNDELFELKEFDTLIIDEASQILEPHLLGIISKVSRFIMIGDEKQLPPVVIQSKENTVCMSEPLNNIGIYNFSDSLFERLIRTCVINRWNSAFGLLEFQARMHEDIQNFAGKQFYQGKLKTIFDSQISKISGFDIQSDNAIERVLASNRMIFVDCPSDIGKVNTFQADLALKFIKSISSSFDLSMNLIGVISPFRMQCFEIYKRLSELEKNNISVDTVERFQGSQRDFIILSMSADSPKILERAVSADISGSLDRKLNVSVTRAKSHFICLGNLNVLSKSEHYLKLIEYIKQSNSIYNYYDFV
jgi:DNA replication ATP-dependent helicase Dna2